MTAENSLKKAKRIIEEVLNENLDLEKENWFYYLKSSFSYLNKSIKELEDGR